MRIAKVERFESHAPLRGLKLSLPGTAGAAGPAGAATWNRTLAPFVTTNHALLGAGGAWTAIDAPLGASLASGPKPALPWAATLPDRCNPFRLSLHLSP